MQSLVRHFLIVILLITGSIYSYATNYFVTNCNDSGSGSLRTAINAANGNSGADTIIFNIPQTDPGYNDTTGVWTIQPIVTLPVLTDDSTMIDGASQTHNQGNTNAAGPEIEITGNDSIDYGFTIESSANVVSGFVINRFALYGIQISGGNENVIIGNYIGTDPTGTIARPNYTAIFLKAASSFNTIGGNTAEERNLVSGNGNSGIEFQDAGTQNNKIIGNYIGTDATGELPLGNVYSAIYLRPLTSNNQIGGSVAGEGNVISATTTAGGVLVGNGIAVFNSDSNKIVGNYIGTNKDGTSLLANAQVGIVLYASIGNVIGSTSDGESNIIGWKNWCGMVMRFTGSKDNVVSGNYIGTDRTGVMILNNSDNENNSGILLDYGANNNTIGPGNVIAHNTGSGIKVDQDSTLENTITRNIIHDVTASDILNNSGGNMELSPPVISQSTVTQISGTACPDCIVELFSTYTDEAEKYEGSVVADATGNFSWSGSASLNYATATATDTAGNTSQLSAAHGIENNVSSLHYSSIPQQLELEQGFPNPFSLSTEIRFSIPDPGYISLRIYDLNGKEVITLVNGYKDSGYYSVRWSGQRLDHQTLSPGLYYCRLEFKHQLATKTIVYMKEY